MSYLRKLNTNRNEKEFTTWALLVQPLKLHRRHHQVSRCLCGWKCNRKCHRKRCLISQHLDSSMRPTYGKNECVQKYNATVRSYLSIKLCESGTQKSFYVFRFSVHGVTSVGSYFIYFNIALNQPCCCCCCWEVTNDNTVPPSKARPHNRRLQETMIYFLLIISTLSFQLTYSLFDL